MDFRKNKKRLGDILIQEGLIKETDLKIALSEQKKGNRKLGETLVDLGYVNQLSIAKALQKQLNIDIVQLTGIKIPTDILALVNEQILRKYMLIPFEFDKKDPNTLRVAMSDPMDIMAIDDLSIITNFKIAPVISLPGEIAATIDRYYGNAEAMEVAERYTKEKEILDKEKEEKENNEDINNSPIVILVKTMIEQAVRQRASDIHIEPFEKAIRIRYRVDGLLKEIMNYDSSLLSAVVARVKILGNMDISEKRKPQDGRIAMVIDREEYDIRVSILPTIFGEKIVMRLTSKRGLTKDKKDLGFTDEEMEKFNAILSKPHGMILVTGPTGSGKSTTLYTALSELNKEDVNIITVEDPVEANIDGINQVQVNPKADLTFASALRSILRQDPDIIMIGEIRDNETAEIAIKASITGHLVVSTLHTNSAASSITRLEDMEVEPYLIADATIGVIAQRLVRRLCPYCKKEKQADKLEKELLGLKEEEEQVIYEAIGCHMCNETGYFGRIGIYEIMPLTPALKELISKKGNAIMIHNLALSEGMKTLKTSVSEKVFHGITSISEMKKILFDD
ncbi:MAG: ATPase, T2SS/T4P/T4SS family [Anaerocolumna aminovalerica]|uniref:Type IV pilus assembly protein PilB n=1 Tax=Anaerocolumna aminovalerica TaxID=1527 RepID=A0A1I5IAE3_9FIRM|nr:ATPase, T2SS/T4P/T4SS family [Anaerocolumna aminovalerica]MDU6265969.1 ATPase, T2SS/T4P/T4SS family [Anaerocolumna aminovalerica]SFO56961.1 type IV pilus assembly protein PilB [Anaerocolumna aminovalerica]